MTTTKSWPARASSSASAWWTYGRSIAAPRQAGDDPRIEPVREVAERGRPGRQHRVVDDAAGHRRLLEQGVEDRRGVVGGVGAHRTASNRTHVRNAASLADDRRPVVTARLSHVDRVDTARKRSYARSNGSPDAACRRPKTRSTRTARPRPIGRRCRIAAEPDLAGASDRRPQPAQGGGHPRGPRRRLDHHPVRPPGRRCLGGVRAGRRDDRRQRRAQGPGRRPSTASWHASSSRGSSSCRPARTASAATTRSPSRSIPARRRCRRMPPARPRRASAPRTRSARSITGWRCCSVGRLTPGHRISTRPTG